MLTSKSLVRNTAYAFLLQAFNLMFPIITAPYVSRILGVENLGKVGFAQSVVGWFVLLCSFGTDSYGLREVSRVRDSKEKLSKLFSELFTIKLIFMLLALLFYLLLVFTVSPMSANEKLFYIYGSTLILSIFSIDWFFQGIEEYKYITNRSLAIKIISYVSLFLFVKERDDYVNYAGILVLALSCGNILNFIYSHKFIHLSFHQLGIKKHFRSLIVLFIGSLVVSVYSLLDQVMLGFLKGPNDVAYFSRSKMVLNAGMALSITISNVIAPRINTYFVNNKARYGELLKLSADIMITVSIPMAFGVFSLSRWVMLLLGGSEFIPATITLMVLSPLLVIVPLGTWNYTQRVLASGNERFGLFTQTVMAITSLVLNTVLIPWLGYLGAAISYCIIETIGTVIGFLYMRSRDVFSVWKIGYIKPLISAVVMTSIVILFCSLTKVSWGYFFCAVLIGMLSYFCSLVLLKDKLLFLIIDRVLNKRKAQ